MIQTPTNSDAVFAIRNRPLDSGSPRPRGPVLVHIGILLGLVVAGGLAPEALAQVELPALGVEDPGDERTVCLIPLQDVQTESVANLACATPAAQQWTVGEVREHKAGEASRRLKLVASGTCGNGAVWMLTQMPAGWNDVVSAASAVHSDPTLVKQGVQGVPGCTHIQLYEHEFHDPNGRNHDCGQGCADLSAAEHDFNDITSSLKIW